MRRFAPPLRARSIIESPLAAERTVLWGHSRAGSVTKPVESSCAYCGGASTTRDHVPPKNLFPHPRPSDLITIPSCSLCNGAFSKDEEYFVLAILSRAAGYSADAVRVLDGLTAPEKVGRRHRLVTSLGNDIKVVKGRLALKLRVGRVNRVLSKIVRGLFFHESQHRMPDSMHVEVEIDPPPNMLLHQVAQMALHQPSKWRGGSVFEWKVLSAADNPNATIWLMRFYDNINAWGFAVTRDKLTRPR